MGIIPLGSANGMATELFVNPKPMEALKDVIMSETIVGLDMLTVNEEHYTIHIGDIGVNAQIVEAYEKDPNRGMATYAKYFLGELGRLKPFPVDVHANGETYHEEVLMVGICNARKYGTGVPINVKGNPMDGVFEIVLVTNINTNSLIKAGLSKFDDSFYDNQSSFVLGTKHAEIKFDEPRLLQLDGEVIGKFEKVKVEIMAGAVKLITNTDNSYLR
jgi:diacylglycerol kinase family enzyme